MQGQRVWTAFCKIFPGTPYLTIFGALKYAPQIPYLAIFGIFEIPNYHSDTKTGTCNADLVEVVNIRFINPGTAQDNETLPWRILVIP